MKFVPARQTTAGTNFTKPRTSHIFGLCKAPQNFSITKHSSDTVTYWFWNFLLTYLFHIFYRSLDPSLSLKTMLKSNFFEAVSFLPHVFKLLLVRCRSDIAITSQQFHFFLGFARCCVAKCEVIAISFYAMWQHNRQQTGGYTLGFVYIIFGYTLAPGYMVHLGTTEKLTINPKMTIFPKTI